MSQVPLRRDLFSRALSPESAKPKEKASFSTAYANVLTATCRASGKPWAQVFIDAAANRP